MVQVGVKEHDNIAICSQNKPHCVIVDFANFANRAVSVPMYATASAPQIEYIVNDAKIALIFVGEQQQYDSALEVLATSNYLKHIVVFDSSVDLKGEKRAMYFEDFLALGADMKHDKEVEKRASRKRRRFSCYHVYIWNYRRTQRCDVATYGFIRRYANSYRTSGYGE